MEGSTPTPLAHGDWTPQPSQSWLAVGTCVHNWAGVGSRLRVRSPEYSSGNCADSNVTWLPCYGSQCPRLARRFTDTNSFGPT